MLRDALRELCTIQLVSERLKKEKKRMSYDLLNHRKVSFMQNIKILTQEMRKL